MKRILAGTHAILEALRQDARRLHAVYVIDPPTPGIKDALAALDRAKVRYEPASAAQLDALAKGLRHQGMVAIGGEFAYATLEAMLNDAASACPLFVALDQITDPHNFGAIVRSAVALGADGVIVPQDRAAPVTGVVVRASAGATERACIARVVNLVRTLETLRDQGLEIVGLDGEAKSPISDLSMGRGGRVLVVGSEGHGLRRLVREHCDVLANIPMPGEFESLNASVAASIGIYESMRARARV